MSISVDGFVTGPDDGPDNGLGTGGEVLHGWLSEGGVDPVTYRPNSPVNGRVFDEMLATGAVVTGRNTFVAGNEWQGDHHGGVPIFVLTTRERPSAGNVHHVTDPATCAREAKAAAGDRDVMMHGATAAQAFLRAGVLDELELHVVPVLLGSGRRLFDDVPEHVELELVRSLEGEGVLHLRYAVRRNA